MPEALRFPCADLGKIEPYQHSREPFSHEGAEKTRQGRSDRLHAPRPSRLIAAAAGHPHFVATRPGGGDDERVELQIPAICER
jgi:hypothetical protein